MAAAALRQCVGGVKFEWRDWRPPSGSSAPSPSTAIESPTMTSAPSAVSSRSATLRGNRRRGSGRAGRGWQGGAVRRAGRTRGDTSSRSASRMSEPRKFEGVPPTRRASVAGLRRVLAPSRGPIWGLGDAPATVNGPSTSPGRGLPVPRVSRLQPVGHTPAIGPHYRGTSTSTSTKRGGRSGACGPLARSSWPHAGHSRGEAEIVLDPHAAPGLAPRAVRSSRAGGIASSFRRYRSAQPIQMRPAL